MGNNTGFAVFFGLVEQAVQTGSEGICGIIFLPRSNSETAGEIGYRREVNLM